jgi:hypothetical protein
MKAFVKFLAAQIGIDTYQRLMAYSILKGAFRELEAVRVFEKREDLWDDCVTRQVNKDQKITFVEFGVHAGYSIKYFSGKNSNHESCFIGLDSFEGLPEEWGSMPKGTFDTQGNIPRTEDSRISFIKGWFQYTWGELAVRLQNVGALVVHYDADLYSSTLFALSKIDELKRSYIAIFDEFTGHETRALYNYVQAYGASVKFLGKTVFDHSYPCQVLCRVVPTESL